ALTTAGVTDPDNLNNDASTPITIPVTTTFTSIADTEVREDKPTQIFGTEVDMRVKPQAAKVARAFVQFDVSSIPSGATVTSATLTLCLTKIQAGQIHELRSVTGSWAEATLTWNNQPTVSATVTDTITVPGAIGCVTFTVTSNVQAWVDGTTNYGWRINDQNEGSIGRDSKYRTREDATVPAEQPKLDVTFVN
ncbi:unnamed protein product, partial [marine sediment metagenome]